MRKIRWHRLAREELYEAAQEYRRQRTGRDERFLKAVEAAIALIRRFSLAGRQVMPGVRRVVVHRFPYSVVYEVKAKELHVLAIAHHRRDPTYWEGRL